MSSEKLLSSLNKILGELGDAKDLAQQELLRADELAQLATSIGSQFSALKALFSDEWKRRYEKATQNRWRHRLHSGFAGMKAYEDYVGHFEDFSNALMEHLTNAPPKREDYISPGRPFDARTRLRSIFKQAVHEIVLVDNFLHPEILAVLQPYVESTQSLSLKFLTRKKRNSKFKSFVSDFRLFVQQYTSRQIEARENNQCHDRFIIIDGNLIYHSGHSFHDIGQTASHINKIEDPNESQKMFADFKKWWDNGNIIA